MEKIDNAIQSLAAYVVELIPIVCPQYDSQYTFISATANFAKNMSERFFIGRLNHVLLKQNSDFVDWLKIAWKFNIDNANYEKNVKQLIYTIEAINECDMLDICANLLRAYQADALKKDEFFRLAWILTKVFSDDLMYLEHCYGKKSMDENQELMSLERYNLVYKKVTQMYNGASENSYVITPLGIKMLSCGIDYDHHNKYSGE